MNDFQGIFQKSYPNGDPVVPVSMTNPLPSLVHPGGMYPPGLAIGKTTAGVVQSSSFRRRDGLGYSINDSDLNIGSKMGKKGIKPADPRFMMFEKAPNVAPPEDTYIFPSRTVDEARTRRERDLVQYHNELKRARQFIQQASEGVNVEENLRIAKDIRNEAQRELLLSDPTLASAVSRGLTNETGIDTVGEVEGLYQKLMDLLTMAGLADKVNPSKLRNEMVRAMSVAPLISPSESGMDEFGVRVAEERKRDLKKLQNDLSGLVAGFINKTEKLITMENEAKKPVKRGRPPKKAQSKKIRKALKELQPQFEKIRETRKEIDVDTSELDSSVDSLFNLVQSPIEEDEDKETKEEEEEFKGIPENPNPIFTVEKEQVKGVKPSPLLDLDSLRASVNEMEKTEVQNRTLEKQKEFAELLMQYKIDMLQDFAKENKIPRQGSKARLINRILQWYHRGGESKQARARSRTVEAREKAEGREMVTDLPIPGAPPINDKK